MWRSTKQANGCVWTTPNTPPPRPPATATATTVAAVGITMHRTASAATKCGFRFIQTRALRCWYGWIPKTCRTWKKWTKRWTTEVWKRTSLTNPLCPKWKTQTPRMKGQAAKKSMRSNWTVILTTTGRRRFIRTVVLPGGGRKKKAATWWTTYERKPRRRLLNPVIPLVHQWCWMGW